MIPPSCRRGQLRAILLLLLSGLALPACSASESSFTPTPIPTFTASPQPTLTRTVTPTSLPTATRTSEPTTTSTPGATSTQTITPTLRTTLTPAAPLGFDKEYTLREWTAADAALAIDLLLAEPDASFEEHLGPEYFRFYRYAAIALAESILRFPDTFPEAVWRWDLAYNLARSGDPQAVQVYSDIVTSGLNENRVEPEGLNAWFASIEPRASLRSFPLDPLPGYDSTTLILVNAGGYGAFLLNEEGGRYVGETLWADFDFANTPSYDFSVADYNGDGTDDLAVYQASASGNINPPLPVVFDLSGTRPQILPFEPGTSNAVGIEHEGLWTPELDGQGGFNLKFTTTVFPLCPVHIVETYSWTGGYFTHAGSSKELEPDPLFLENCDLILDHAIANWGTEAALGLMEPALAEGVSGPGAFTIPPDLQDKWRFRLGIYNALLGNYSETADYLNDLIGSPADPAGPWPSAAQEFLTQLAGQNRIYPACASTDLCPINDAAARLIEAVPVDQIDRMDQWLAENGVPVRTSGEFDFEGDGDPERWLAIRPEGRFDLDLWIVVEGPAGLQALHAGVIDTVQPAIEVLDADSSRPVIQIGGNPPFTLEQRPISGSSYLSEFTNFGLFAPERVARAVAEAKMDLLNGAPPAEVAARLIELQNSPTFICVFSDCPDFLYTLALAHELGG
ncbi:MAG TPA: hypothetical protein VJ768_02210, partial [Anaerolineales bacterium]|nr:hypothetical protein [Anaerolineales bacterium]